MEGIKIVELLTYLEHNTGQLNALSRETYGDALIWTATNSIASKTPKSRRTHLMYAAHTNNVSRINFLLDCHYPVNAQCSNGYTALSFAIAAGHNESVEALLAREACPYLLSQDNLNALLLAIMSGHEEVFMTLLDAVCTHVGALNMAFQFSRFDFVRTLLERGATPDTVNFKCTMQYGYSSLHWAIERKCTSDLLRPLIVESSVKDQTCHGVTSLMLACKQGHSEAVDLILDALATTTFNGLDTADSEGNTCVHHAVRSGNLDILRSLAAFGFRLNQQNARGLTPLKCALRHGTQVVETLCALGCTFSDELTFLESSTSKPLEMAKILIDHGCTLQNCKNGHNEPEQPIDFNFAALHMRKFFCIFSSYDTNESLLEYYLDRGLFEKHTVGILFVLACSNRYVRLATLILLRHSVPVKHLNEALIEASRQGIVPLLDLIKDRCDKDFVVNACQESLMRHDMVTFKYLCGLLSPKELQMKLRKPLYKKYTSLNPVYYCAEKGFVEPLRHLLNLGLKGNIEPFFWTPKLITVYCPMQLCDATTSEGLKCLELFFSHGYTIRVR